MGNNNNGILGLVGAVLGVMASPAVMATAAAGAAAYAGYKLVEGHDREVNQAYNQGLQTGHNYGYRQGAYETQQRLIDSLCADENDLVGVFALGIYVSRIDGHEDQSELDTLQHYVGRPDASFRSSEIMKRFNAIYNANFDFNWLCNEYLNYMHIDLIQELHELVIDIINADGIYSQGEQWFYENQWQPYYNNRLQQAGIYYQEEEDYDEDELEIDEYSAAGDECVEQKNYGQAIAYYNQAINAYANNDYAYASRGEAYEALGYFDQAIADVQQAININPNEGLWYFMLGDLYEQIGNYEQANYYREIGANMDSRYI